MKKPNTEQGSIVYINQGKKLMSDYDFVNETGIRAALKEDGIILYPTHDHELLNQARQELFVGALKQFKEERRLNKLRTTESDIQLLRYAWLKTELGVIEAWLSSKKRSGVASQSTSNQIEILKYQKMVRHEMESIEEKHEEGNSDKYFSDKDPLRNYRLFIGEVDAFIKNVELRFHDYRKLRMYCGELLKSEFADLAHRAQIEIERLVYSNKPEIQRFITVMKRDAKRIVEEDQRLRKSYKLAHKDNFVNTQPYFAVMQTCWNHIDFLQRHDIDVVNGENGNAGQVSNATKGLLKKEFKNIFDLFQDKANWRKYLDALISCEPPLLKNENGKYRFIGKHKTQRGVIGAWFKELKDNSIIDPNCDRETLARVLKDEIVGFTIGGSTIDQGSSLYKRKFAAQLNTLTKSINQHDPT